MHHQGRVRIAPVNPAMLSARIRDPRLMRMKPQTSNQPVHPNMQHPPPHIQMSVPSNPVTRMLPKIPRISQSNSSKNSRGNEDRDPRTRKNKEKLDSKSNKSPSSKDKSKSSPSSKSSSRSRDRVKSGSSDDSSPRKRSEDDKKFSRNLPSHHRGSSHSSKSPSKSTSEAKDIDLRLTLEGSMKPDSTTHNNSKSSKDKLLSDLLNGDDLKSSQEMITSDNGKENKSILVVAINAKQFIVTMM